MGQKMKKENKIDDIINLHELLNEGLQDIKMGNTISADEMLQNFKEKWKAEGRLINE